MVKVRSLIFKVLATSHLETEESTHWLLRCVGILLALDLFLWDDDHRGSLDYGLG
jgi:hypothetical protein